MAYIKINLNTYLSMNYNWFNLFSCSYVFQKKPVLLFSCLPKNHVLLFLCLSKNYVLLSNSCLRGTVRRPYLLLFS